jgi:hypothetical protein
MVGHEYVGPAGIQAIETPNRETDAPRLQDKPCPKARQLIGALPFSVENSQKNYEAAQRKGEKSNSKELKAITQQDRTFLVPF